MRSVLFDSFWICAAILAGAVVSAIIVSVLAALAIRCWL
jgi:hypothetical protein